MTSGTFRKIIFGDGLNVTDESAGVIRVDASGSGTVPSSPGDATKFLNGAATPAFAQVKDSDLSTSDVTSNNASTSKHGFLRKLDNNSAHFLDGTGAWSTPPTFDPITQTSAWMPLTTVVSGTPDLVWSGTDNLIPTYGPL